MISIIVLKMEQFDFTKQHMYYWEKIQTKMASSANPAQTAPLFGSFYKICMFSCFRQELNILAFQPWTNLEIRKSVDQTINEVSLVRTCVSDLD